MATGRAGKSDDDAIRFLYRRKNPFGGHVAETEAHLDTYYVCRETFLDPIAEAIPNSTLVVGPKGVGKSAVLSLLAMRRYSLPIHIHRILPKDLTLWSLISESPDARRVYLQKDPRFIYKKLWELVFMTSALKAENSHEHGAGLFERAFGVAWPREEVVLIKGFLEKTTQAVGEEGTALSSTFRLMLDELEAQAEVEIGISDVAKVAASVKAKAKLQEQSRKQGHSGLLYDLNKIIQQSSKLLKKHHLFLIDDLDEGWTGDDEHVRILESFVQTIFGFSKINPCKLSFVAAMREDIYGSLTIPDGDKFGSMVQKIRWGGDEISEICKRRIEWAIENAENNTVKGMTVDRLFDVLIPKVCRPRFFETCKNSPRRAVRVLEAVVDQARTDADGIDAELVMKALSTISRAALKDLAGLRPDLRGLDDIAMSLSAIKKPEFSFDDFELFQVHLASRIGSDPKFAATCWITIDMCNQPIAVAMPLLELGLLLYKEHRTAVPERFDGQSIDPGTTWLAISPEYLAGLGFGKA